MKDLHVGDSVLTYSGGKLAIISIRLKVGRTTVHNFQVKDFDTYYVSGSRVLVHNNGEDGVTVEHYYKGNEHGPPHAHVSRIDMPDEVKIEESFYADMVNLSN